jgi:glycosyltransferase involved in cell wall biosynthesis/2-polyprenyl-3-methyl-5-hydroxy-6-metoxy-1,4-benzoquinol methylase
MLKIIFVVYHNFKSNSAIHVHNFATALVELGNECIVAVPDEKETVYTYINKDVKYRPMTYDELNNASQLFSDFSQPDVIHAWTPRENVRKEILQLKNRFKSAKIIIHLEDNDKFILEKSIGMSLEKIKLIPEGDIEKLINDELIHPLKYKDFINSCDGVTVIMDKLLEFVPKGKESMVLWPILDEERFYLRDKNIETKKILGISEENMVICYIGNTHSANVNEIRSLYVAIALANREGIRVKLIRTGIDYVSFLGQELDFITKNIIKLGFIPHEKIPEYLSLADLLIQPGKTDPFNDYRLPSKLPEFLGMGIPVVLPNSNLGRFLKDMDEAFILKRGDSLEILEIIKKYNKMRKEYKAIGEKGLKFAQRHFNKKDISVKLMNFYNKIVDKKLSPVGQITSIKNNIFDRYSDYQTQELSYSTVNDFCDSLEHLGDFCNLNGDLKNVQRPWMIKAIISKIKKGGKILEIGAGEPTVANFLSSLGYDVTVIDPYDGNGNGPKEYEYFRNKHPNLKIIRKYLNDNIEELAEDSFDCIYSISVLEHVDTQKITDVFGGIKKYLKKDGCTIHNIDHVLLGNGEESHYKNLRLIFKELYIEDKLNILLSKLKDDVETYFLSVEGHLLWKGNIKYEDFPFRRVVSINICKGNK